MSYVIALIVRSILTFAGLVLCTRLAGVPFKTVFGVTLGAMAAIITMGTVRWLDGIVVLAVWGLLYLGVTWLRLKVPAFHDFLDGKPTVLIQQGKVLQNNLRKSRMSAYDMMAQLREKNAFKLADVEFGMLEPDGQVSVMLKSNRQPVTPLQQNIPIENESVPTVVVVDGTIIQKALADTGFDRIWLWEQVSNQGAKNWKDVFLAQIDSTGNVYVDLVDDVIVQTKIQSKPLLLASLNKIVTDLEGFALQTENPEARTLYENLAKQLKTLIQQVAGHLRG